MALRLTFKEKVERAKNLKDARADREELEAYGYTVHSFTEWHWRVSNHPDYTLEVDVWPTTKKVMNRQTWQTQKYKSLLDDIVRMFSGYEA